MKTRTGISLAAAGAAALMLAGCYGNWLMDIVKSFGSPNGPKIITVAGTGTAGYSGDGGPATSAQLSSPSGVAVDAAGNVYIADTNNNRIRKIDTNGTISTIAGDGSTTPLNGPVSVAVDPTGTTVYIADSGHNLVKKVTGGTLSSVATSSPLDYPTGVALDGSGNLFIADFNNSVIVKMPVSGGSSPAAGISGNPGYSGDGISATSALLNYPYDVAVDSTGNLYIADTTNYVIRKVDAGGIISTFAGNGVKGFAGDGGAASGAEFSVLSSLAADSSGNLFIADWQNNVIRRIDSGGTVSTVAGNWHLGGGLAGDGNTATAAMLNLPWGVAVDASGNLYIADTKNHRIRKVIFH